MWLVERLGRRMVIQLSLNFMGIFMLVTILENIILGFIENGSSAEQIIEMVDCIIVTGYIFSFSVGIGILY